MLTPFFSADEVHDEASAKTSDVERYAQLFHGLRRRGVYAPPSPVEAWFVSLAHTEVVIDLVVHAVTRALAAAED
jgi:glutamate-1-semialdehyde 2,1-aminomutase